MKKPAKSFLKGIGEQSIRSLLYALNLNDLEGLANIDKTFKVKIEGSVYFEEFYHTFETLYCKTFAKRATQMTFNQQFLLHKLLQKCWLKASSNLESWQYFINEEAPSRLDLITYLYESSFLINDESAQLCLVLCALAFDSSTVLSFKPAL